MKKTSIIFVNEKNKKTIKKYRFIDSEQSWARVTFAAKAVHKTDKQTNKGTK